MDGRKILAVTIFIFASGSVLPPFAHADYTQELRDQIKTLAGHYPTNELDRNYFHDMGIIARKADEADLPELTTEIVQSLLLKAAEKYISDELLAVNVLYETDAYRASERLKALLRYERFYKPTEEYKTTTAGQVFSGEAARLRQTAIGLMRQSCADYSVRLALQALYKTALFITDQGEEAVTLRELQASLDCCLAWKSEVHYRSVKEFESDYEKGTLTEEARLKLDTGRGNYSEASWVGEWSYRFKGREGVGEGTAQARLRYRRNEDSAALTISNAKVSSVGRINFPMAVSGESRDLLVEGQRIYPVADFSEDSQIPLYDCRVNTLEEQTKPAEKEKKKVS